MRVTLNKKAQSCPVHNMKAHEGVDLFTHSSQANLGPQVRSSVKVNSATSYKCPYLRSGSSFDTVTFKLSKYMEVTCQFQVPVALPVEKKKLSVDILLTAVWDPDPVWTFRRRGRIVPIPANKPLFHSSFDNSTHKFQTTTVSRNVGRQWRGTPP